MAKVTAGKLYIFDPVPIDQFDPTTRGITKGDVVRVVNLPGCPKANVMNHCHIERADTSFNYRGGLVHTNSLLPIEQSKARDLIRNLY